MKQFLKKKFWFYFAFILVYYILFQSFYNLIDSRTVWPYNSLSQGIIYFGLNYIPIALTFAINYAIVFGIHISRRPLRKLIIDIVISFVCMSLLNILFLLIISFIEPKYGRVNWGGTIFNNIFILFGLEIIYFVKEHIHQIQEISENRQKTLQYQYDALCAQVDPHFLFNTLNILYALIDTDREKSKQAILSLAHTYRYVLDQQGRKEVDLRNEVSFVKEYMQILKLRYGPGLEIEMNEPPEGLHYLIPFSLQLLVENVVKHNKVSESEPMRVTLFFTDDSLTVSNPIHRKASFPSTRRGLEYLDKLYAAYGKTVEVTTDNDTFTVKVPFINNKLEKR